MVYLCRFAQNIGGGVMCYPHKYTPDADGDMIRADDGEWVKASDYDALRAKLAEAEGSLTAATARITALEEALKYYGGEDGVCINDGGKRAKAALAHNRVWTGPGHLEETGYTDTLDGAKGQDPLGDMPASMRTMTADELLAESVSPDPATITLADELAREIDGAKGEGEQL